MQRFYIPVLEPSDESFTIKNPDMLHQMHKVLRVKVGESFVFFNGVDLIDYTYEVVSVDKREIYLEQRQQSENISTPKSDINIVNALPNKLDKIEYILQKWVEVWVTGFYFFKSDRSQKLVLSENKIERLKKIIIEAVEQSGRWYIPELIIEDDLHLEYLWENKNIFFHTQDEDGVSLNALEISGKQWINLFVWPEWGFSEDEISAFKEAQFTQVYLWNTILRTETAWVVSAFYLNQK